MMLHKLGVLPNDITDDWHARHKSPKEGGIGARGKYWKEELKEILMSHKGVTVYWRCLCYQIS